MQSPAHFLIGAGICRCVKCKPAGFALALASHYALDALPHFEDPSILPRSIARLAGDYWQLVLAAAQILVVCLALGVWLHYRRGAAYLVAGGLLACLPDYLHWIGGIEGVVSHLNRWSHQWWFMPYLQLVRAQPDARPLVAAWCLAIEFLVCAAGALAVFAGVRQSGLRAPSAEETRG